MKKTELTKYLEAFYTASSFNVIIIPVSISILINKGLSFWKIVGFTAITVLGSTLLLGYILKQLKDYFKG